MAASEGEFKAGHFYFPTSTGSFSVEGLEIEPQGIIFFGGNQDAEDTLLHPTTPGAFFGMAWLDVDSGNVDSQCQALTTFGTRWNSQPVCSLASPGNIEYAADTVVFDPDGFTLSVSVAAPGSRLVHYLAWGSFDGAEGKSVGGIGHDTFDFPDLGYRPLSMLGFSMFSSGASRVGDNASALYFSMGVANFPTEHTDSLNHNAMALAMRAQTQTAEGLTHQWFSPLDTAITYTVSGGVVGTWADNWDHVQPYPTFTDEGILLRTYGSPNRFQLSWLDCEASAHSVSPPAFGVETVTTARSYVEEIQAALFFGTTGYSSSSELGVNQAYVFGVCTLDDQGEGYQGVVAFDGGRGDPPADGTRSFFQSKNACFANSLSPGGGIRVASGFLDGNELHLTGEISSNPNIGPCFVQLWGREEETPTVHQQRRYVGGLP